MELETLKAHYLDYLRLRNGSERSIGAVNWTLRRFLRYLAEQQGLLEVHALSEQVLRQWQKWLSDLPSARDGMSRSPASVNRELAVIRAFCHWLKDEHYLGRDLARCLSYAKEPKTLPRDVLTEEEARKVIEAPDCSTVLGFRDRTMLEVLYSSGIRKGELIGLLVDDLRLGEGLLEIRKGKGLKDRVVPIGELACQYLLNYLRGVRPEIARYGDTGHVFLSRRGRGMGKSRPLQLVQKYAKLAGIAKTVTCHVWRHTCATHMVRNDANIRLVQQMLGHERLSTTERYLSLTIGDLKEAHRACHPRERMAG